MTFAPALLTRLWSARFRVALVAGVVLSIAGVAIAETVVDTILSDLHRPRGIAIRPGGTADRFEIYVADTGSGRVVRWSSQSPHEVSERITGFEVNNSSDSQTQTGPMAVGFLDPGLLVVGTTQSNDGSLLQAFELQDDEKVIAADAANEATSNYSRMNGDTCTTFVRARTNESVPDRLLLTVRDDVGATRLMSARVQAGIFREPKPFGSGPSEEPRAVAISNSGRVVVADADGKLVFFSPVDGQVELTLDTELKQPMGLAYNPSTGNLYAADFAGGIYRLEDASQPRAPACRTVKVADAKRPTAIAFGPDGSLYLLTFGDAEDNGTLSVVTGEL